MEAPSEKNETLARFNDAETKGMQTKKERNWCTVDFSRKALLEKKEADTATTTTGSQVELHSRAYLSANLISTLASLQVHDFTHDDKSLFFQWTSRSRQRNLLQAIPAFYPLAWRGEIFRAMKIYFFTFEAKWTFLFHFGSGRVDL